MARWKGAVGGEEDQHRVKRLALLREAGRAFSRNGFHNTSLDEVAAELDVTKPALYYYFRNKHEMLYACCEFGLDLGDEALRRALGEGRCGLEKLRIFMVCYIADITSEIGSSAVMSEIKSLPPADIDRLRGRQRKLDQQLRRLVQDGIDDGSIAPCDPALAVAWTMGAINHVPRWYRPDGRLTGRQIAEAYVGFLTHGLAFRPG